MYLLVGIGNYACVDGRSRASKTVLSNAVDGGWRAALRAVNAFAVPAARLRLEKDA